MKTLVFHRLDTNSLFLAVISLLVGQAITKVTHAHPDISGPEVAICLSLFCGIITSLIGLCRLGILVDFISEPAIAGYMTGSALTISLGQWPKVFGLHVSSRQPPYLIIYNFFKHLNETQLDAAFGLTALVALYVIKIGGSRLAQRMPARMKQALFFVGIMRSGLVVIAGTFVSFLVNRNHRETPLISIIEEVPAGFDAMGVPSLNWTVFKEASSVMPSIILIMILEHVSVAKSFGRLSNYVVDPNQEILAIGMSNIVGSFFGYVHIENMA
jgi:MFS superfamily sulfate permease-like transporter